MEAITRPERVGESSRRNRGSPSKHARKSLAESPQSLPRAPRRKRKRRKDSSAEFYLVKQILAEKIEKGHKIIYLIDWEDNPETGETYTPTWEPFDNVNKQAVDEWIANNKQALVKGKGEGQQRPKEDTRPPPSSFDPSSQPIRTAQGRRRKGHSNPLSSSLPPAKKPRRVGTVETARFQSVSQETVDSPVRPTEIKDSWEDEQSLSIGSERFRVEIPLDEGFDRDAYARVTIENSQPSQNTSSSQPSQLSRPFDPLPLSQSKIATPQRFIWDSEDSDEDRIVPVNPDSEDLHGSSSYKSTQTHISQAGPRPSSSTDTEADLATPRLPPGFSAISTDSPSLRHSQSDPTGHHSIIDSLDESAEISQRVHSSTQDSLRLVDEEQPSGSAQTSQDNPIRLTAAEPSAISLHSSILLAALDTSNSASSTDLPTSSETRSPNHADESYSQAAASTSSWLQPHQSSRSVNDESSVRFQTQVSLPTRDENSSQSQRHTCHVSLTSHEDVSSRPATQPEAARSQTSSSDLHQARSLALTQNSILSFEATWQAAQVVLASPQVYDQEDEALSEASPRNSPRHTQDAESQPSTTSVLGNLHAKTQRSPSKSQEHISSEEGSDLKSIGPDLYLGQPSENVLPSIEQNFDTTSLPTPTRPSSSSSDIAKLHYTDGAFSTPPPSKMADQAMGEMSTAERLRQARAKAAETKIAEQRAARTASAIAHTPPPPPVNQILSLREPAHEAPVVIAEPDLSLSPKSSSERQESVDGLQILPLGENVFTVPLPMVSMTRVIYNQEITNYRPQRQSFLDDDEIDDELVEEIDTMFEHLKMLCDHQDLIDTDSATQQIEPDHRQARWAENISTKCMFIIALLDSLQSIDAHVVLLVRSGRMMDILEAILRTNNCSYSRPESDSSQAGRGLLRVSLLSTDGGGQTHVGVGPTSLVIAFDSTFKVLPFLGSLRVDPVNENRLAPLVHLVITHSIEHLELCFKKNMSPLERKALLVASLPLLRTEMGILPTEYLAPEAAAKDIADFIVDEAVGDWPLLTMPDIEGIAPIPDTIVEEESNVPEVSGSTTQSYGSSTPLGQQAAIKRPLVDDDDLESFKRQRLTPVDGVSSIGNNVSRIEETMLSTNSGAEAEAKDKLDIIAKSEALDAQQKEMISSLLSQIVELEDQLRTREATETELRLSNNRLEARCKDYESSIERITPKYQEALNEQGQAAHDLKESLARETSIRQKLESRTAEVTRLREEKTVVEAELVAARTALAASSIPEVAELQKLKDDLRMAKLENEKAQKKINIAQNDREYMLSNYQNASNAAAEMRNEIDELKTLNTVLTRKASSNAVEIHRIQAANDTKLYLDRIDQLEAEKAIVERELEKKTEEVKMLNSRRSTRGASPRTGTKSPGPSARPIARVFNTVGSRGNSPAPGADGAYRGPGTFGEAMVPGGVARWGHHLS